MIMDFMEEHARKKGMNRQVYVVITAVVAIAIVGIVYFANSSSAAQATVVSGDNVSVYYTGTYANGTVFDSNVGKQPLSFKVGAGQIISGFENAVVGMKINETKTVTLTPSEAYGNVNPNLIITVSRNTLGNLTLSDGEEIQDRAGQVATVVSFNAINVTLDFNSKFAGQTLTFKITLVSIGK